MKYILSKLKTPPCDRVFRVNLESVRDFLVKINQLYQEAIVLVKCILADSLLAGPAGNRTPEILLDEEDLKPIRAQQKNDNTDSRKLKTPSEDRIFSVDPTGLAPVSLRVDGRILLHKTTGPGPQSQYETKRPLFQGIFLFDTQI